MSRSIALRLALAGLLCLGVGVCIGWKVVPSRSSAINWDARESLYYFPLSREPSRQAMEAGSCILSYLNDGNPGSLDRALEIYQEIIPKENFGQEYSALAWFCRYAKASDVEKRRLLKNKFADRFIRYFRPNNYKALKDYLVKMYLTDPNRGPGIGSPHHASLLDIELVKFNSPLRQEWEKSDKVLEAVGLRRGDAVADIGCGLGYYSFQFSDIVGETGTVFAVETNRFDLDYMATVIEQENIRNIRLIHSLPEKCGLEEKSVSRVFMCAAYQAVYGSMRKAERGLLIESIKRALKDDGILVVSDNETVLQDDIPFQGISISRYLVIPQLQGYGFKLVRQYNFIPQRYLLIFKKA